MMWQPIATAPKDGTRILVMTVGVDARATIAYYDDNGYNKTPRPFWQRILQYNCVKECRSCPPTHWMPLPSTTIDDEASGNDQSFTCPACLRVCGAGERVNHCRRCAA